MRVLAFECFADRDVFEFLKHDRGLPLEPDHCGDQGRVVHAVLVKRDAHIGLVDDDPMTSHHARRDATQIVRTTQSLVVRREGNRYLLVVRPSLEECFQRSMKVAKLDSKLPSRRQELHALLGISNSTKHKVFQEELSALYRQSRMQDLSTLVTDLDGAIREILEASR